MTWSKKVRIFNDLLADSLKGRLSIHTAAYRRDDEERGRTWLALDKKEAVSFCDFMAENAWREMERDKEKVFEAGIYGKSDFGCALGQYLNLSIDDALISENPIIEGLAYLDRRVGKRKLARLDSAKMKVLPKLLYMTRMQAEGMKQKDVTIQQETL